jgi:hypothetical protein
VALKGGGGLNKKGGNSGFFCGILMIKKLRTYHYRNCIHHQQNQLDTNRCKIPRYPNKERICGMGTSLVRDCNRKYLKDKKQQWHVENSKSKARVRARVILSQRWFNFSH